jgi:N-acetylmuramoyl-L-alanine amidase
MQIRKILLTKNDCYKAGRYITPRGIMVHSTGANNPWLKRYVGPDDGLLGHNPNNNHWNMSGVGACVHAFIGKDKSGEVQVYQTLPWTMRGWHCGRSGNDTHISFEICEDNLKDPDYFGKIYAAAVELCVKLCRDFNLPPESICDHAEGHQLGIASNHGDVMHWFPKHGKSMDTLRADVKKILEGDKMDNKPATWAKEAVDWAVKSGILKGDEKGDLKLSSPCTRQEMVVFLHRLFNLKK